MELKHLTIVKDKRSNCLSCMGITTIQDYIKYIEDIYKIKGGIEGQRDALRTSSAIKIRKRMVEDIVKGTVLPPVVLGLLLSHEDFIKINTAEPNKDVILEILSNASDENISLIDGMQRTTAIIEAFKMSEDIANNDLRVEIWIVENLNNLMYRMLVLNTGQVPWTIRRQLEVVYGSLLKTIKNSVPEIEIYAIDDSKYRTDGGQYQGESIIELFIVFGSRKEKVNIKERVAEEFTRLDFIESTDKSDLLSMFIRCLQIMYKVDKAFTRFESQNKTGKCCKIYTLYAVHQHNRFVRISLKKQNRNKINNLIDSQLFVFHLVSSLALGRIQSASSSSFMTIDLSPEEYRSMAHP